MPTAVQPSVAGWVAATAANRIDFHCNIVEKIPQVAPESGKNPDQGGSHNSGQKAILERCYTAPVGADLAGKTGKVPAHLGNPREISRWRGLNRGRLTAWIT